VLSRKRHQHLAGSAPKPGSFDDQGREHAATDPTRSSRATCRRLARSPPLQGSFRASSSLRSQIATCQHSRPMQSRQTRDKTIRRQLEKLAQPLSWVPPLFALFVLRYRRICKIAGQPLYSRRPDIAINQLHRLPHCSEDSERYLCVYRKSSPSILVMQSTQDRTAQNASRCLGGTRYRRVLVQR